MPQPSPATLFWIVCGCVSTSYFDVEAVSQIKQIDQVDECWGFWPEGLDLCAFILRNSVFRQIWAQHSTTIKFDVFEQLIEDGGASILDFNDELSTFLKIAVKHCTEDLLRNRFVSMGLDCNLTFERAHKRYLGHDVSKM
eukprot:Selendium_serpulae@DN57_c0_g1_i1.p2